MELNDMERRNLVDALEEWFQVVGPKELEDNEVGLNSERYEDLMRKLREPTA